MKPNPGGQIAADDVVGRDGLVASIWEILDGRSIYMNDLRRVGKTVILSKLEAQPPAGWLAKKRDLGGCHTAAEFATCVYRDSAVALGTRKRALRSMSRFLESTRGVEIAGVIKLPDGTTAPWKEVLTRTFSDLEEELPGDGCRMVFLWDEVPFLLDNVRKREGPQVAMEILDVLRALSQDCKRVRLVITGSVGLHHILTALRDKGYNNSPLNHMERIAPGPLSSPDARRLASALIQGAGLKCDDPESCAQAIADAVGNVAFYVHKLVSRLPKSTQLTTAGIEACLDREIAHPDNDWDFAHYRTRLKEYFGEFETPVLHILDAVAARDSATFEQIRREVSSRSSFDDEERLRDLLKLLQQDHYFDRDSRNGSYRFRFILIRRWWRFDRGLGGRS